MLEKRKLESLLLLFAQLRVRCVDVIRVGAASNSRGSAVVLVADVLRRLSDGPRCDGARGRFLQELRRSSIGAFASLPPPSPPTPPLTLRGVVRNEPLVGLRESAPSPRFSELARLVASEGAGESA